MHDEKDNQLHYHLIISANKVDEAKRYYHSKMHFERIKVQLETYVLERYPQLEQDKLISKDKELDKNGQRVKSTHANKREGEYVRRTGKLSQKQQTANRIKDIFLQSDNLTDYSHRLREAQIDSYVRGKTMGFVVDGRKHRINTLGIAEEFDDMLLRFQSEQQNQDELTPQTSAKQTKTDYDDMVAKRMAELNQRYQDSQSAQEQQNNTASGKTK